MNRLIENHYFNVGNVIMKQTICIPMGSELASFWENISLYSYEEECMTLLMFYLRKSKQDISSKKSTLLMNLKFQL